MLDGQVPFRTESPVTDTAVLAAGLEDLAAQHPVREGRVAPHRLYDGDGVRIRHLAFDAGAELTEHVAPKTIVVTVPEGRVRFTVEGEAHELSAGAVLVVAAGVPHAVLAHEPSRLLITFVG